MNASPSYENTLVGPFMMSEAPDKDGGYVVVVKGERVFQIWFYLSGHWYDSDDGLGSLMDTSKATAWFGANRPGVPAESLVVLEVDDGLGV